MSETNAEISPTGVRDDVQSDVQSTDAPSRSAVIQGPRFARPPLGTGGQSPGGGRPKSASEIFADMTNKLREQNLAPTPEPSPGGGGQPLHTPQIEVAGIGPEEPSPPDWEPNNNPEWLASPERGRWLVEQIIFMETKLRYEDRYNVEHGPRLEALYSKLKEFVERMQEDRYKEKAFDPQKEHQVKLEEGEDLHKAIQRTYDQWKLDKAKSREEAKPLEDLSKFTALRELVTKFNNAYFPSPDLSREDREKAVTEREDTVAELLKYFKEADKRGLLVGVNSILDSIYEEAVTGKRELREVIALANQQLVKTAQNEQPGAYISADYSFANRLMSDPDVINLHNIWEPYLKLARQRLESEFQNQEWTPMEGEWRPTIWEGDEQESAETYWTPYGGYPNYYLVTAETPAQFRKAMESFIEIIRNGSLGYSPTDLMNHIQNFQQVYSAQASRMAEKAAIKANKEERLLGPEDMTLETSIEDRQELQGRTFLWYAFYQYEHYNKEEGKNGATALALNEGPARHTAVLRSGEVGSSTWDYDYSPEIELALNAQGSRGQLGAYTLAQEYLRDTIFEMQREKRMGVVLRDYDRRDRVLSTDPMARRNRDKRLEEDDKYLRRHRGNLNSLSEEEQKYYLHQKAHAGKNRHRIGIHQSAEEMRSLYEGFDYGDAHKRVYKEFKGLPAEELKLLPKKLLKSFRLGMVQAKMGEVRDEIRTGGTITDKDGKPVKAVLRKNDKLLDIAIDVLIGEKQIEEKEKGLYKRVYQEAYARAKASFEITQQLEGISHESTVRGGGVYFIYRNKGVVNYVREYINFRQEHQKKVKATDPDDVKEISKWSPKQRSENFTRGRSDQPKDDVHIGWIIDEMSKGRRLDDFPTEEQSLYRSLHLNEQDIFVDNVPIHQAQEYGMAAVNWVMMHYADDSLTWQEDRFKIKDAKGKIIVDFINDKNDKDQYLYPNFRAIYRTAVLNKILDENITEFTSTGFSAKLRYQDYDFDIKTFNAEKGKIEVTAQGKLQVMTYKKPHIFGYTELGQPIIAFGRDGKPILGYDEDGKPIRLGELDIDPSTKQPIIYAEANGKIGQDGKTITRKRISLEITNTQVKQVHEDGKTYTFTLVPRNDGHGRTSFVAVDAVDEVELDFENAVDSYLALHTTHTYWAYQSNNTHTLIPEYVFEQARQIRDGLIRPEDADIFAGLLLTLDPTLNRIKSFPGDKMSIEGIVFDAAVEQSLMGSIYVKTKLNEKTMPRDGNSEFMGIGYFTEDLGGDMGFSMESVARMAKMPKRWARRFDAIFKAAPIFVDSMARNVGRKGVTGATTMMADNIKDLSHQPIMSQFAITKFINMLDSSTALWFVLVGGRDPKDPNVHHEGLFMKPTNNAERLMKFYTEMTDVQAKATGELEILNGFLESFGRVWDTLKVIRTMYSDVRNAGGALLLERKDIVLPNGRVNPEITLESERNTGTSRHIAEMFWDAYVDWLLDEGIAGGAQAYPDAYATYQYLNLPFKLFNTKTGQYEGDPQGKTWKKWLFEKMVL